MCGGRHLRVLLADHQVAVAVGAFCGDTLDQAFVAAVVEVAEQLVQLHLGFGRGRQTFGDALLVGVDLAGGLGVDRAVGE